MAHGEVQQHKRRRINRRKINKPLTLQAYEQRIRSLPQSELEELAGAWLSSYDVWGTIESNRLRDEIEERYDTPIDNHAIRLSKIALERGVAVLGITSERQQNGRYVAEIPIEGGRAASSVIYIGGHNSFTKRASSKWSIGSRDKRYEGCFGDDR